MPPFKLKLSIMVVNYINPHLNHKVSYLGAELLYDSVFLSVLTWETNAYENNVWENNLYSSKTIRVDLTKFYKKLY